MRGRGEELPADRDQPAHWRAPDTKEAIDEYVAKIGKTNWKVPKSADSNLFVRGTVFDTPMIHYESPGELSEYYEPRIAVVSVENADDE